MANLLDRDIQFLPGTGPKRAAVLAKEMGIYTFRDLLHTFPYRYIDRSRIYSISDAVPSMSMIQIRARIFSCSISEDGRHRKRLTVTVSDGTGKMELVFFQGIKWLMERLKPGKEYIIFGKVSEFGNSLNMVHPEMDPVNEGSLNTGTGLAGIYPSTENMKKAGIGNKVFIKLVRAALDICCTDIRETIPHKIIEAHSLMPLKDALENIHFPKSLHELAKATRRLKFEELFFLQLAMLKQKYIRKSFSKGNVMPKVGESFNICYNSMPFPLTNAQKRVIKEIRNDLVSGKQMNRLLQGDVGSGKTAVSLLCALLAIDNGFQACLMAPTEVLAAQHYNSAIKFFGNSKVRTALLTGSTKTKERNHILEELEDGSIDMIIGTHALIEEKVVFRRLGLAIIDEQHRFGVKQRSRLWAKSVPSPHILVMTATPIPRTLAMTIYGDLDVSVIDEMPPGRKPVKTIHSTEADRQRMYAFLKSQIKEGRQVFIVYPLIKESEKMDYKNLQEGYMNIIGEFKAPEYITAVVHGKQKNEDKAYDMNLFASGKAHILVATSVIEVGVDVPNASVIVIESAERFGLSQLHQLRGRVGRGSDKSYCILMTGNRLSKEARQRIELMCSTQDGFELSEADLKMRGPGDLEGTQQSGTLLDLKLASPVKDNELLRETEKAASEILEKDPELSEPENRIMEETVSRLRHCRTDYSEIS